MVADLLRVQALLYLSTPFISIPEAIMGRAMDFRRPALVNLIAAVASAAVALTGALSGWGVWTLVFARSEEHTSELQSLMRISYAVFCLKKKKNTHNT